MSQNNYDNDNTTAGNADSTVPSQTGTASVTQSSGVHDNQNLTYPSHGQQHTGAYDNQKSDQPNPTYPSQGQQRSGAYNNQNYDQSNPAYPSQEQQRTGAYDNENSDQQDPAYPSQTQQRTGAYDNENSGQQNPAYPSQEQRHTDAYDDQKYTRQNPTYPPQGQQPVATDQQRFNNGPAPAASAVHDPTQPSRGQYGNNPLGYGAGTGTVGYTQQDNTQINQGRHNHGQYGGQPPTSLTNFGHGAPGAGGQRVGDSAIPPANLVNPNSTTGGSTVKRTIGKVQHVLGSKIDSDSLREKGLRKQQEAVDIQQREIEAARGSTHPANPALGGAQRTYN